VRDFTPLERAAYEFVLLATQEGVLDWVRQPTCFDGTAGEYWASPTEEIDALVISIREDRMSRGEISEDFGPGPVKLMFGDSLQDLPGGGRGRRPFWMLVWEFGVGKTLPNEMGIALQEEIEKHLSRGES
jgi:hypothetical protein